MELDREDFNVNDGDQDGFMVPNLFFFQVFFLNLQFYSPLPRAVLISREIEGEWQPWQMYATDCQNYFSQPDNGPLPQPDSVNCLRFKRSAHSRSHWFDFSFNI